MKLLTVDTIKQATEKINNHISWQHKTKTVSPDNSLDSILAEDVFSSCDIPSFRRSTVDGYAVIANDTSGATDSVPVFLKPAGVVSMGKEAAFSIKSGECAYVPTGGMLPEGADAVVMIEYSEEAVDVIAIYESVASGMGTAETGEDFKGGRLLLGMGTFIQPQEIGALSAAGITSVSIFAPLTVSIFSTGDELVASDQIPAVGQIRDINTNLLKALAKKYGYEVVSSRVFPDDEERLETAVREAAVCSDIVLISGGSSQGEKDFTAKIIDRIATPGVFTHGLAVKPGKPTILGWDDESKTLFAGLPGHPVSAMMIFTLLFKDLQTNLLISNPLISFDTPHTVFREHFHIPAQISCNVSGSPGRATFLPVVLKFEKGIYYAEPVFGKAGMISTLTRADGYIEIDLNKEGLKKGEQVFVNLL